MVDFGYSNIPAAEKQARVRAVFNSVASRYDLMNDVMSLGIHRLWKDTLIRMIAPRPGQQLLDIAGGTGDIAMRFLRHGGGAALVLDINTAMLAAGRQRPQRSGFGDRLGWAAGDAEALPLADDSVDVITIAFGLRNVTDRQAALSEGYRVLRPGGRFYCLEFSHVRARPLAGLYDLWSSALPGFGGLIASDAESYRYLVESIRRFPDQEMLAAMFARAGFARIRHRDLSAGIAAIHCGWKLP